VSASLGYIGRVIEVIRRVDRLFENVSKLQTGHDVLADRIFDLERRVTALESREELLVERMGNRASEAATGVVNGTIMEMARRLGGLEERVRSLGAEGQKRIE
jgi:hypothetical protein